MIEKAPHINYDITIHPEADQMSPSSMTKSRYEQAKQFAANSLYGNDVTKQYQAMTQTLNQPFMQPLNTDSLNNLEPISMSPTQAPAFKQVNEQRRQAQRGNGNPAFGMTTAKLAHGLSPRAHKHANLGAEDLPTAEEMKRSGFPSISSQKYDELLQSKPYVPRHHLRQVQKNDSHASNILSVPKLDDVDYAEIER